MVKSNFEYTEGLIKKINSNSVNIYNLIIKISMAIILLSSIILFITHNFVFGAISFVVFVCLLASLLLTNRAIITSNKILIGQKVNILFKDNQMDVTTKLGEKVLYNASFEYQAIKKFKNSKDLIYLYFDRSSVIIIPKTGFKNAQELQTAIELVSNNYVISA